MRLVCLVAFAVCLHLQAGANETPQELQARLTGEQRTQFDSALQAFRQSQYAAALVTFKALLQQLPGDAILSKLTAEAALNTGDSKSALDLLRPVAQATPDDWTTVALLARAYAESGDNKARDATMARIKDLHAEGATPANAQSYILEHIKLGDNTLVVRPSLTPWGPYNAYYLAQLVNPQRETILRMTLESPDTDQALFAQQNPKEAAMGMRSFSVDGYQQGPETQTHMTFWIYTGEPSYDTVREEFIGIAEGKIKPVTSRTMPRSH